jgi:predicted O-methyltransferase YrrM
LYSHVLSLRPRAVLEVGTHIGAAAVVIGSALKRNDFGKLITLEPQEHYRDVAKKFVQMAQLTDFVDVLPISSEQLGEISSSGPFEIIFIDALHEYDAVCNDLKTCAHQLAKNGLIFLHDAGKDAVSFDKTGKGGVRNAVMDFVKSRNDFAAMFYEHPLWLNPCGLAVLCRQVLN